MDKLFGEYLVKCKVLPPPEPAAPAEESKEEAAADADVAEGASAAADVVAAAEEAFYPYEKVSVEDTFVRTSITHVLVLFTAEYCPPCEGFM